MTVRRQRTIQAAEKLVQRGRLEAAIGEYRKVLREAPNDTRTLNRVGDLYLRLGTVDEAVDLFRRAASHFSREGFYVKAIAIYKKIIRVDPTRIAVYEALADLYHQQGLGNEARAQYQVVADYHAQNDDVAAVIGIHRKIVDLDPQDPAPRLALADIFLQAKRPSDAMKQYREIAELMVGHERYGEAIRFYVRALEIDASDLSFLTDAVLELKDRGQNDLAEQLLGKAESLNPGAAKVRGMTGLVTKPATEPAEAAEPEPETETEAEPPPAPEVAAEAEADDEVEVVDVAEDAPAPEPVREEAAARIDLTDALEFEIGLDELEEEPSEDAVAAPGRFEAGLPPADPLAAEAQEFLMSREEALASEAGEEVTSRAEQALELMAEAQVLAAYGLDEKAVERFEQVLEIEPESLEAHRRLLELHLHEARTAEVEKVYARAREAVPSESDPAGWEKVRGLLTQEGFGFEGDALVAPEAEAEAAAPPEVEAAVEMAEPAAPERAAEESSVTWLDRLGGAGPEEAGEGQEIFGEEQEFFDLAAELEQELEQEEERLGEEISPPAGEQSLEEIVKGFKKGVSESLSEEDYDTHYNLGIAYREMGLLDEAIGEFQLAAKDPRYLVDCCSLLGASFLEKGFGDLAVKWFRRGLESPEISEEERLGLLYELGNLHLILEERDEAREVFVEIYGVNSNYRDVVAKLEELRGR